MGAINYAETEALKIFTAPIFTYNSSFHQQLGLRWFNHGRGIALFFAELYQADPEIFNPGSHDLKDVFLGAYLHDIGKRDTFWHPEVWVLDEEAFKVYAKQHGNTRRHVDLGVKLLERYEELNYLSPFAPAVYLIVGNHHAKNNKDSYAFFDSSDTISRLVNMFVILDQIISRLEERSYHKQKFADLGVAIKHMREQNGAFDHEILGRIEKLYEVGFIKLGYSVREGFVVWDSHIKTNFGELLASLAT